MKLYRTCFLTMLLLLGCGGIELADAQLPDSAGLNNIWINRVPFPIQKAVESLQLLCPDTAYDFEHCGFVKLSEDWSCFAFEQTETRHYNNIFVFEKVQGTYIPSDTLFGTVQKSAAGADSKHFDIVMFEAYWGEERPQNREYYVFKKGEYYLTNSEARKWPE